jgi:hypothetical protein
MDFLTNTSLKQKSSNNKADVMRNNVQSIANILPVHASSSSSSSSSTYQLNLGMINEAIRKKRRTMCGKGAHSKVWKYVMGDIALCGDESDEDMMTMMSTFIAAKEIDLSSSSAQVVISAMRELTFLKHLSSSFYENGTDLTLSFVKCHGVCLDPTQFLLHIGMEYSPLGTLQGTCLYARDWY